MVVCSVDKQLMAGDETDTHRTIQQLCERIHQLEAVSWFSYISRCCIVLSFSALMLLVG